MSQLFGQAYPDWAGSAGQLCSADNDCQDGLACLPSDQDPRYQTCQVVTEKMPCTRSQYDQRCHRILANGYKGNCPDSACPPLLAPPFRRVDPNKCEAAQTYYHPPTRSSFCLFIDDHTGVPEQMPEKCCNRVQAWNFDLPNQNLRDAFPVKFHQQWA